MESSCDFAIELSDAKWRNGHVIYSYVLEFHFNMFEVSLVIKKCLLSLINWSLSFGENEYFQFMFAKSADLFRYCVPAKTVLQNIV